MLCWGGLGKWLEVRASVVVDLKVPQRCRKESWAREFPQQGTGAGSTLQSEAGRDPNMVQSIRSCGFSLRDNREDSHGRKPADFHLSDKHSVSYLPLDPIFKHSCLLLCAYVILVM